MKLHHEFDYDQDCIVGRDPRTMTTDELTAAGKPPVSLLAAIRENCIGCAGGSPAEVRRCAIIDCSLWPFRMGANPYRAPMSPEQKASKSLQMAQARSAKASKAEAVAAT